MSKLPVIRLVRHAYLDTIAHARGLMRVGGPWLLLSWALLMLARDGGLLEAAANLAVTMGAAAIAVAWHRHILLGEPLSLRMAPLNRRVARYFALTVLIAVAMSCLLLITIVVVGGGGVGLEQPGNHAGAGLAVLLVMVACLYLTQRLQLVFPATAIGDRTIDFGRSWTLTRGNGWRLLGGFLLVTLPVAAALLGLALLLAWAADATGSIALTALSYLAAVANAWLQAPLIASFLSFAYVWFRDNSTTAGAA
ncbi:MAG: hypothetical protein U1E17_00510 [Geminicoccaceae bacterium]